METISYRRLVLVAVLSLHQASAQSQVPYSHGNPTGEEQFMLEQINRARSNPTAEGQRLASENDSQVKLAFNYFHVDLTKLRRDFTLYPQRPPLAMNADLLRAARRHSTDMARNNFQSHTGSNGSSIVSRIRESGYDGEDISESIYSSLVGSLLYAHTGLNVDWGSGSGGLQPGLGHRRNNMNFEPPIFREMGVGVVARSGADAEKYGKLAVTENFGTQVKSPFFLLGVVYNDSNSNGICDPGEGLSGVRVTPSVGTYHAVTSSSGGYAIPFVLSHSDASVVFSGGGLVTPQSRTFSLIRANTKVDIRVLSPVPLIEIQKIDSIASERGSAAGGKAAFRVKRNGATGSELRVTLSRTIKSGTGKAMPNDYKITVLKPASLQAPGSKQSEFNIIIPKGKAFAEIRITAVKDKKSEPTEKVKFVLSNSANYQISSPNSVVISIKK